MDPTIGVHAAGSSKATDDAHDAEEKNPRRVAGGTARIKREKMSHMEIYIIQEGG